MRNGIHLNQFFLQDSWIFFRTTVSSRIYISIVFGVVGMVTLFWRDVQATVFHANTFIGIALCFLGTYGFSLGNMLTLKHQKKNLDLFTTTAYAMLYGALLMLAINLFFNFPLLPTMKSVSIWALLYLAIFGSVIGFCAYFLLIRRIGASNAAYSTLLFPIVALAISIQYEGYVWHSHTLVGMSLILLGNIIFLFKRKTIINKH